MASRRIFMIFVLPIILSLSLATAVMADVLDKPGREMQMWPPQSSGVHGTTYVPGPHSTDDGILIMGLSESYRAGGQIVVGVSVSDATFDCGDLYITIYDSDNAVLAQEAFFEQCFADAGIDLPAEGDFETAVDSPGSYVIVAEMRHGGETISTPGEFVVE
ncbi:MAG: hypothetical protein J4F28_01895 [Nitrosopumilaceae archaeon]|nr:hypothetical protein [Nitrosopumilaceae archaeon]